MKNSAPSPPQLVLIGTRISPEQRDQFRSVAAKNNRSVAGHLRHMIEEQIAADHDRGELIFPESKEAA